MTNKQIRKCLERGWRAYERKTGVVHPEKIYDDYETRGIVPPDDFLLPVVLPHTQGCQAIAYSWMCIGSEIDQFKETPWAGIPRAYQVRHGLNDAVS